MTRDGLWDDPLEEPAIDPEDMPEPLDENSASLAIQRRTRERFHEGMPRIDFDDVQPLFRPTTLYLSVIERGMLTATVKFWWQRQHVKDDIHQETWLRLLKPMRLPWIATAKELFTLAYYEALHCYNACCRDDPDAKPAVASQIASQSAGEGEGKGEEISPLERVDLTQYTPDPVVEQLIDAEQSSAMDQNFGTLPLKDQRFLTRYAKKLQAHNPAQRKRAERLRKKMKENARA